MRKLDAIALVVFLICLLVTMFATMMSLASGSSVNNWNTVIAVNLLVMAMILAGRLVVGRVVVKQGKEF